MPRTRAGRWSIRLFGASVALFAAFFALVASGQRGGDTFSDNLWLSGTALPAAFLTVVAAGFGLVAVIKERERSLLVFAAIVAGLVVLFFAIGEVVAPH